MKYPVGIQTFSEIREKGYVYVDKTALIYKLIDENKFVFLSRPRRFGKSLLLSTIQAYFEGRKELFEGLALQHLEKNWIEHPVFRFDLSGENYIHPDRLIGKIAGSLRIYESKFGITGQGSLSERFFNLIFTAEETTGRKVVILIDEYDKPLLDTLYDIDLHKALKNELRGFYGMLKQCDEYIRFAMLTGVSKFGKITIFSGLNNLEDITLSPDYNAICGITENEIHQVFSSSVTDFAQRSDMGVVEAWKELKDAYDGYHFSYPAEDVYNPFSLFKALKHNQIGDYWFESGSSSHLIELIEHSHFPLPDMANPVRTERQLSDISIIDKDLIPLLFQAGYLTIKGYNRKNKEYHLGIPNSEVNVAFWECLINHFFEPRTTPRLFAIENFRESLLTGDVDSFLTRLKSLMADTNSEHEPDKEIHFQNMMAIFVKLLGYVAQAESHTSRGRCDLTVETPDFIYIFEFKVNSSPEEALLQIEERGYAERFEADRRTRILSGVNFSTKKRTLESWKIKRIG